ncbi:CDP-alcohol phosphatidyltransferase family protein [Methylopila henanensis]|uniref:CDP-alcohol phosphatidyltransferase family protein n=1 Tax=Methylopila henanensis TaxID=873516 RepID=A0ABW4K462_9HYPH
MDSAPSGQPAPRRARLRFVPLRLLLPNLVTLLALCAGLTGVRMAIEGRLELAVYLVVLAGALDGVDGRLARLLKGTSRFGAELDSLADFVSFGVAPALILYVWGLNGLGHVGWMGALVFAIAGSLRLARFNVALDDPNKPAWAGQFFVGVPAPAGAIAALLPIYLEFLGFPRVPVALPVVLLYVLAIALLMVSPLPTWSGKQLGRRVHLAYVAPLLIGAALIVTLLISYPWAMLALATLGYLGTLPFAYLHRRRLVAMDAATKETPTPSEG